MSSYLEMGRIGALDFRKLGLGAWILENGVYGVGGFFFEYFLCLCFVCALFYFEVYSQFIQEHWRFQVRSDLFW